MVTAKQESLSGEAHEMGHADNYHMYTNMFGGHLCYCTELFQYPCSEDVDIRLSLIQSLL